MFPPVTLDELFHISDLLDMWEAASPQQACAYSSILCSAFAHVHRLGFTRYTSTDTACLTEGFRSISFYIYVCVKLTL